MPRDGAQNYSVPGGTDGVPDTPVLSTPYNGFLRDLEQDLNTPRPILAGGTGASNARDAMINLGGEMANQGPIANYADYPFMPGTFFSNIGATDAPPTGGNATEMFMGICYGMPGVSLQLEARGYTSHLKYWRSQTAGVWGPWSQQAAALSDTDAMYVNVTGDTMTGDLAMTRTAAPTTGYTFYGNAGRSLGTDGAQMIVSDRLALPLMSPAEQHAVRRDQMDAADLALKNTLQANIDLKADKTALPVAATAAEFRANSAPSKMLTPGAVWGAAGYQFLAYGQQIDLATGFDFYIPGGPIYNPLNAKSGQKGVLWLHTNAYSWGSAWRFPNSVKPVFSGGYDIISYAVYDGNTIWCSCLPACG